MSVAETILDPNHRTRAMELIERLPIPTTNLSFEQLVAGPPSLHDNAVSLSKWRTVVIISGLAGTTFASSMSFGILTVSLPRIAADLGLPDYLLLWYLYASGI